MLHYYTTPQAYLQACILRRRMRSGVQLPCPDSRTAELRLELQVGAWVKVVGYGAWGRM